MQKLYLNIILLFYSQQTHKSFKTLEEFQMTGICPSFYFIFCAQKYLQKKDYLKESITIFILLQQKSEHTLVKSVQIIQLI